MKLQILKRKLRREHLDFIQLMYREMKVRYMRRVVDGNLQLQTVNSLPRPVDSSSEHGAEETWAKRCKDVAGPPKKLSKYCDLPMKKDRLEKVIRALLKANALKRAKNVRPIKDSWFTRTPSYNTFRQFSMRYVNLFKKKSLKV